MIEDTIEDAIERILGNLCEIPADIRYIEFPEKGKFVQIKTASNIKKCEEAELVKAGFKKISEQGWRALASQLCEYLENQKKSKYERIKNVLHSNKIDCQILYDSPYFVLAIDKEEIEKAKNALLKNLFEQIDNSKEDFFLNVLKSNNVKDFKIIKEKSFLKVSLNDKDIKKLQPVFLVVKEETISVNLWYL